jgi:hypothetical protein
MPEPTRRVQITVGQDLGLRGFDLVQRCADIEWTVRKERPEIEWAISANLACVSTTIKVEPDWPGNYAEVNQIVGPLLV